MKDYIRAIRAKRGLSSDVEDYETPVVPAVPQVDDQAAREAAWAAEESAGLHGAAPVADAPKSRPPLTQAAAAVADDDEMEQLKSMAFGQRGPTMADLAAARKRDVDSRMAAGIESSLRDGMATILGVGRGTQVLSPSNEAAGVSKAMAEAGDDRRKSLVDYIRAKREGRAADTAESEARRKAGMDAERMGLDREKFGYQRANDAANRAAAERRARIMAASAKERGEADKHLTAGQVDDLASLDLADLAIDNLESAYREKASAPGSSVSQFIPGSEAKSYGVDAAAAAKTIGKGIEGARMTDADMRTYEKMMPLPTDTNEMAAQKIATLRKLARAKRDSYVGPLEQGKFQTPPQAKQTKGVAGRTGTVRVQKDGEVLEIPASDLGDAERDGYAVVP